MSQGHAAAAARALPGPVSVIGGASRAGSGLTDIEVLEARDTSQDGPLCADTFGSFWHFPDAAPFPRTGLTGLNRPIPHQQALSGPSKVPYSLASVCTWGVQVWCPCRAPCLQVHLQKVRHARVRCLAGTSIYPSFYLFCRVTRPGGR